MNISIKHPQSILAIDTKFLTDKLETKDGVNMGKNLIQNFFNGANEHLCIRRRQELESNENYLQILPYAVIAKSNSEDMRNLRISAYYRPVSGGESRLHGNLSIGYGGHIDLADVLFDDKSVIDFSNTVRQAMYRELREEVGFDSSSITHDVSIYGFITDKSNSVGRVHLGIVHLIIVPEDWQPNVSVSEVDLAGEFTSAELRDKHESGEVVMESWSKLVVDSILN